MTQATACLNDDQIDSLLQGNLTPHDGTLAEEHLAECERCRTCVEETIGSGQWWTELRSVLGDATVDRPSARASSGAENPSTAMLLDLLGPTDDPNMLGRIGPYEIVGLLGSGGMGAVFKGFDRSLHRFVAIKLMLPHLASSAAARRRFAREGQAVAAVVNDHVMPIHCVDEWRGVPYLVMTYARGVSLQKRLSDKGPLELQELLRIGLQTAKGLAAAHAQGIVHRDVKPANILLDQTVERVQLMDFGLARAVDDASLTRTGALAGTPQYMSPEQARGEAVDPRSDLFSLGSVLYAMCTGRAPFRAESSYGILRLITDKEPRPIRELNPELPVWLSVIIGRLMAKRPDDRYASASEVALLLEQCLAHVQQPATAPLPNSLRPATANRRGGPSVGRRVVAAACTFFLVLAGVLIVIELNKGTLSIESEVDDIPIRITQSDETVDKLTVTKSGKSLRVAAGQYRIELDGAVEGLRIEGQQVDLTRGGRSVVKIVRQDSVDGKSANAPTDTGKRASDMASGRGNTGTPDGSHIDRLARAVERLNQELRLKYPIQDFATYYPPLTKDELIACASWRLRGNDHTDSVRRVLTAIAQHHQLPDEWMLDSEVWMSHSELEVLRPEDYIVGVFRIFLQKRGSDERFTVRERRFLESFPKSYPRESQNGAKGERTLVGAIKRFNARYRQIDGQPQPPLTEGEVLATIFLEQERRDQHDVSDELFERVRAIGLTGLLPEGAEIEVIPTFGTVGGDTYTIWSIRLKLPQIEEGRKGWTYAFVIREQFISVKHQDAGEIQWGSAAPNGIQVGVRLDPPLKNYAIGQKVDVTIYYRNILTKPIEASIPNFLSYELEGKDASGQPVAVVFPRTKVIGGARVTQLNGEPTACRATPLVFSAASKLSQDQEAQADHDHVVVYVEAGKSYRLRFGASNYASAESELRQTGEIELTISDQVTATPDSDEAILATIAAKQLKVVFESSDAILVTQTIKVLGRSVVQSPHTQ